MKKNSFLWAALSMTAALVMTACSNDDSAVETPAQHNAGKIIPYTVTVGHNEAAGTRATVESDMQTLYFANGDKLYISGTDIQGVLDIQEGTGTASATFSGDLTYSGEGSPAADLELTATLVSAQQSNGSEITVDAAGAVTVNYPTTAYCADVATAVQKYSNLTGTSTYSTKSFSLTQQTAFLNFEITVTGSSSGTPLPADVISGGASIAKANVTTVTDNGVKAKFVLPVAAGTELNSATVKLGGIEIGSAIGNASLSSGKVYNVKRTVDMSSGTLAQTLNTADVAVTVSYRFLYNDYNAKFISNGDGTFSYLGGGYDGSRALVVEGGKLVFRQNSFNISLDYNWGEEGYAATLDPSANTYSEFKGSYVESGAGFNSVIVNGKQISVTEVEAAAITFADLDVTGCNNFDQIVSKNPFKIYSDNDQKIKRYGDDAVLTKTDKYNPQNVRDVERSENYDPDLYTYSFVVPEPIVTVLGTALAQGAVFAVTFNYNSVNCTVRGTFDDNHFRNVETSYSGDNPGIEHADIDYDSNENRIRLIVFGPGSSTLFIEFNVSNDTYRIMDNQLGATIQTVTINGTNILGQLSEGNNH